MEATLKCDCCGHTQKVMPASTYTDDAGYVHQYFGSRYDFCDECDGPVTNVLDLVEDEKFKKEAKCL